MIGAMVIGGFALAWCFVLAFHAFAKRSLAEAVQLIGVILWLTSNYVWM